MHLLATKMLFFLTQEMVSARFTQRKWVWLW